MAGIGGLGAIVYWQAEQSPPLERLRNFYGVVCVRECHREKPENHQFVLEHGWVTHGLQFADADKRHWTTAYYGEQSGVGQTLRYFGKQGKSRVAVIGLGVGTLAAYAQPGDDYRFYEINPAVLHLANKYFSYLRDCAGSKEIIMGDARLSLEREDPQRLDTLVLDAFSGASPPTHLLTREAFDIYRRHVGPDGVIAINVTNYHLNLEPVVRGLAEHFGYKIVRVRSASDETRLVKFADWMLLSNNEDFLRCVHSSGAKKSKESIHVPLWTDHYSNLWQIL
jgi:spermidine synthase